jgi:hypothetical protein
MRTKQISVIALLLLTLGVAAMPANGAASTGASIELSSGSYLEDSPVTIRVYDVVAAGSTFTVFFTYDLSGTDTVETNADYANITVTLGTDDDEWVYTMIFESPTAGAYIGVHVTADTSQAGELAADYIYAQSFSRLWPQDLIIEIGISLMVVLIIVGVVVGLAYVGSKKLRGG